ncbi:hypothetical protein PN483_12640 [Nodularia spumigena CS-591/04]|uniref:hypothetical protein n=1 Tax=Nodularia spumigena TaxID=70799 RepID=UPI002330EADE|nr:hypothetical protein [Nodularia spumigena]MDB9321459.1 hypothetical protein [Nodularia spumigena CS-591/07A]MDB9331324.1 hypothetical protein [Nodularia spumigena CS-591/04]MDB9348914.1 hypothetical protein [Nodularia spumigena CS-588/01]MDB9351103.1 hypothetical protein [Nodularia spumigena CS-588/05]MDB9361106.1 hypothetical protein [Nodularia spumigena CS-588/02]
MLNKWNFVLILLLSIFVSVAAGVYFSQGQQFTIMGENGQGEQLEVANVQHSQDIEDYPGRYQYQTISLENITSALQGSDPATLALNALDDPSLLKEKPLVEVVYPQPNQALVKITQVKQDDDSVDTIKYRVEMTTFGRSLLANSPPIWQIVWAGSQIQCRSGSSHQKELVTNC